VARFPVFSRVTHARVQSSTEIEPPDYRGYHVLCMTWSHLGQASLRVDGKRTSGQLYDYEVYLRQDWRMGSQVGMEWETGIGAAASRHTDQTDFESKKYTLKRVKQAVGNCRGGK